MLACFLFLAFARSFLDSTIAVVASRIAVEIREDQGKKMSLQATRVQGLAWCSC